jgi:hypothetical protein
MRNSIEVVGIWRCREEIGSAPIDAELVAAVVDDAYAVVDDADAVAVDTEEEEEEEEEEDDDDEGNPDPALELSPYAPSLCSG